MHTNKLPLNENLINECLNYLNIKDLSVISQVNKIFNHLSENYNHYWREECNKYFCSSYEHNKYI